MYLSEQLMFFPAMSLTRSETKYSPRLRGTYTQTDCYNPLPMLRLIVTSYYSNGSKQNHKMHHICTCTHGLLN